MQELRFKRVDGDFIVLEDGDGETFLVAIDDSLRRSVKQEVQLKASNAKITPREIQVAVRAGSGIAELAEATGAPYEYIEKFASPVLDELAHVVQTALSVRITVAGDRYSENLQIEFGDLIQSRILANGFNQAIWSSSKAEFGDWHLTCDLGDQKAEWVFDLRKLVLSPENEIAVHLSSQQVLADSPIPKLKVMQPAAQSTSAAQSVPAAFASQQPVAPQLQPNLSATADLGDTLEFDGVIPFGRSKPIAVAEPTMGENLANTADLLDALRKRRQEREALEAKNRIAEVDEVAPVSVAANAEPEPQLLSEAEATQVLDEAVEEVKPSTKKGRSAVPSWNDIVFGTRTDD